jgi:hypothetical protein
MQSASDSEFDTPTLPNHALRGVAVPLGDAAKILTAATPRGLKLRLLFTGVPDRILRGDRSAEVARFVGFPGDNPAVRNDEENRI